MVMKERMARGMLMLNGKAELYMNGSSNGFRKIKKQILSTMEVMRDRTVQAAIKTNVAGVVCFDMEEDNANKYLLLGAGLD